MAAETKKCYYTNTANPSIEACLFLLNKSPKFHNFFRLLFETVFYSKQSSIEEISVPQRLYNLISILVTIGFMQPDPLKTASRDRPQVVLETRLNVSKRINVKRVTSGLRPPVI